MIRIAMGPEISRLSVSLSADAVIPHNAMGPARNDEEATSTLSFHKESDGANDSRTTVISTRAKGRGEISLLMIRIAMGPEISRLSVSLSADAVIPHNAMGPARNDETAGSALSFHKEYKKNCKEMVGISLQPFIENQEISESQCLWCP